MSRGDSRARAAETTSALLVADGEALAPAAAPSRSICPAWSYLFDVWPGSPALLGAVVATLLCSAFLLLDLSEGRLDDLLEGVTSWWRHPEVRSAIVIAVLFAGVGVTYRYEELGSRADVARLRPHLRPDAGCEAALRDVTCVADHHDVWIAGVLGSLLFAGIVPFLYRDPTRFLHAATYGLPSVLFDFAVALLLGGTILRTVYAGVVQDRAFARLAHSIARLDLLDLEPVHVFSRRGLRRTLRWAFLTAVASLVVIDAGWDGPPTLVLLGIVGFAVFSFLLPVRGAHDRVRAEKRRTLEALRASVRAERERLESAEAGSTSGRLADLLAYEARIAGVSEWPIDGFTLLRFSLYLLLPFGSWLGGALVERIVNTLLG